MRQVVAARATATICRSALGLHWGRGRRTDGGPAQRRRLGIVRRRRDPWYLGATPLATLPWLIRLRWTTATIEAIVVGVAWVVSWARLPAARLRPRHPRRFAGERRRGRLALAAAAPLPLAFSRRRWCSTWRSSTGLLDLTGGPFNPFSVILVVQVTLAALTLGARARRSLGGFAAAGFGLLVYWHLRELDPVHHRLNDFPTHLFTMWIAVAATAELAAYFVVQASNALARREEELEAMRQRAARTERLVSLTTLAAGAAHELSTPLATIALASRELEHAADARGTVPDLAEDARLIRAEVDRCQAILDQMSGRAGGSQPTIPKPLDIRALVADIRVATAATDDAARLQVRLPERSVPVLFRAAGLSQASSSLVKNAFDATDRSRGSGSLTSLEQDPRTSAVHRRDQGPGMSPKSLQRERASHFSRPRNRGAAWASAFPARVFAERVGGGLTVTRQTAPPHVSSCRHTVRCRDYRRTPPDDLEARRPTARQPHAARRRRRRAVSDAAGARVRRARVRRGGRGRLRGGAWRPRRLESPEYALVDLRLPGGRASTSCAI